MTIDLNPLFPELSPRQVTILKAVAHGMQNDYIAKMQGDDYSPRTVEYHVSRIIDELQEQARVRPALMELTRGV